MSGGCQPHCIEEIASLAQSRAMKTSIMTLCLTTICGLEPAVASTAQQTAHDGVLTILIYDNSGWSDSTLNEVESMAGLILSRAEIGAKWLHCAGHVTGPRPELCDGDLTAGTVLIRIVPAHLGQPSKVGDPLGAAVIDVGYASLFASEVRRQAGQWGLTPGTQMGYALAHEIGHLLLGEKHAATGLMRAVWTKEEYRAMTQSWLGFSASERQALRDAIPSSAGVADHK